VYVFTTFLFSKTRISLHCILWVSTVSQHNNKINAQNCVLRDLGNRSVGLDEFQASHVQVSIAKSIKFKAIPVQASTVPEGSRWLRLSDFQAIGTRRPPLPPGNTPGTHFSYRLSRPQDHSAPHCGRKDYVNENPNRTRDLPACSAVPQSTRPPRGHKQRTLAE